jgi:flavin reductase (DIM6/NTAB) family NADH-FMN oxidoreductase RutF
MIEPRRFRAALGRFATGVTVVTTARDGEVHAMTANAFTSVSLDPPLVAFLPDKASTSWPRIREAGSFCANVLSAGQEAVSRQFARSGGNKFRGIDWTPAPSGAPIIAGAVAWVDCDIEQVFESGDHYIVIGRVRDLAVASTDLPLTFWQGRYTRIHAPLAG